MTHKFPNCCKGRPYHRCRLCLRARFHRLHHLNERRPHYSRLCGPIGPTGRIDLIHMGPYLRVRFPVPIRQGGKLPYLHLAPIDLRSERYVNQM